MIRYRRIRMTLAPNYPATRYEPSPCFDLSAKAERERLSPSAIRPFSTSWKNGACGTRMRGMLLGGISTAGSTR